MDKLAYMTPPYESEIRAQLVSVLGGALGQSPEAARIRLPAKMAHASFRPPEGVDVFALAALAFGSLYGARLVGAVRVVNGWLLFDFSPDFFRALVEEPETATAHHLHFACCPCFEDDEGEDDPPFLAHPPGLFRIFDIFH
jgi:hypothetical protein